MDYFKENITDWFCIMAMLLGFPCWLYFGVANKVACEDRGHLDHNGNSYFVTTHKFTGTYGAPEYQYNRDGSKVLISKCGNCNSF